MTVHRCWLVFILITRGTKLSCTAVTCQVCCLVVLIMDPLSNHLDSWATDNCCKMTVIKSYEWGPRLSDNFRGAVQPTNQLRNRVLAPLQNNYLCDGRLIGQRTGVVGGGPRRLPPAPQHTHWPRCLLFVCLFTQPISGTNSKLRFSVYTMMSN